MTPSDLVPLQDTSKLCVKKLVNVSVKTLKAAGEARASGTFSERHHAALQEALRKAKARAARPAPKRRQTAFGSCKISVAPPPLYQRSTFRKKIQYLDSLDFISIFQATQFFSLSREEQGMIIVHFSRT